LQGSTAGFAIHDSMQYMKCDVSTICIGLAASFGAFLLAGGLKSKRLALCFYDHCPRQEWLKDTFESDFGLQRSTFLGIL